MSAPLWIKTLGDIDALVASLKGAKALSIDTEADGLHHYPVKLCLVQIADDRGDGHLADPLALPTLAPLAPFFADAGVIKILHAADNDLGYLKRLYGFTVENLFDTAIAARFLGVTSLSLDGLLRDFLGVDPGPSRQKDDWSKRPLSKAQETYALNDVLHLIPLRERLLEALRAKGRDLWVEEECAAVAAMPAPERVIDPDAYMRLKADRPPFMILGNEVLVALAALKPRDTAAIMTVKGCTPHVVRRTGEAILAAVERGLAVSEAGLPVRRPNPRPRIPGVVQRRSEALRAWRVEVAKRVELDPGVIFPQRLIDRLAHDPPTNVGALAQVEGVGRWRA